MRERPGPEVAGKGKRLGGPSDQPAGRWMRATRLLSTGRRASSTSAPRGANHRGSQPPSTQAWHWPGQRRGIFRWPNFVEPLEKRDMTTPKTMLAHGDGVNLCQGPNQRL